MAITRRFLVQVMVLASVTSSLQGAALRGKREDDVSLGSLTVLVQQQARTLQEQGAQLQAAQTQLASLQAAVNTLTPRVDTQVSFTARMGHSLVTVNDSPFPFDQVVSSVGTGYNSITGVFTAPVSGVYLFYSQVMNHAGSDRVDWALVDQAGRYLCRNELDTMSAAYDKSTCLATVHLAQGNQVYVRRTNTGTLIEGGIWSSFTGHLLSMDA